MLLFVHLGGVVVLHRRHIFHMPKLRALVGIFQCHPSSTELVLSAYRQCKAARYQTLP